MKNFIKAETRAWRAVTMSVLMAFVTDLIPTPVTRHALWKYMSRHKYAYVSVMPSDASRLTVTPNDMTAFYTRTLPEAINGAHPSLVFNIDNMGPRCLLIASGSSSLPANERFR